MKKTKKSYMNISNILSEKVTLGNVLKYLSSINFKKSVKAVEDLFIAAKRIDPSL